MFFRCSARFRTYKYVAYVSLGAGESPRYLIRPAMLWNWTTADRVALPNGVRTDESKTDLEGSWAVGGTRVALRRRLPETKPYLEFISSNLGALLGINQVAPSLQWDLSAQLAEPPPKIGEFPTAIWIPRPPLVSISAADSQKQRLWAQACLGDAFTSTKPGILDLMPVPGTD
jgi:hypothetical protein